MGNYRSGNKYRVAIGLETSLGSGNTHSTGGTTPTLSVRWEDLTVMPVKLELSPDRQMIDTNYKTYTYKAVDSGMKQRGLRDLKTTGGYNT